MRIPTNESARQEPETTGDREALGGVVQQEKTEQQASEAAASCSASRPVESEPRPASGPQASSPKTRRGLLRKVLLAAGAALGAGALFKQTSGTAHADGIEGPTTFQTNDGRPAPLITAIVTPTENNPDESTGILCSGAVGLNAFTYGLTPPFFPAGGNPPVAVVATTDYGYGVYASASQSDPAIFGINDNSIGITGASSSGTAVYGQSSTGYGMHGASSAKVGVVGSSSNGTGVQGTSAIGIGVEGISNGSFPGVKGISQGGPGVEGIGNGTGTGVYGVSDTGSGVWGSSSTGVGVYASNPKGTAFLSYGSAKVVGNLQVTGSISKGGGSFLIDHPLDPENKELYHSFVESAEMKNIYDGVVVLDQRGEAVVSLPEWFGALNTDCRYQLTCLGGYAPVYIASEITKNQFTIAGGQAGLKVCWQITGVRQDRWAQQHRIPVEVEKPSEQRGLYHYPELYGQPVERGIHQVLIPINLP